MNLSDDLMKSLLIKSVHDTIVELREGLIYKDDSDVVDIKASSDLLLLAALVIDKLGRIALEGFNIEKVLRADLTEAERNLTTALDRIVQLEKGA
jgi:hypothetical protein